MQIGFGLPISGSWATPRICVEVARRAEELGYHSLWAFQRLLSPVDDEGGYRLAPQYRHVHDPLAMLAYVAGHTQTARLGVAVVNAPFYSPVVLAKSLTTVDHVSEGRLDVGLGLGWMPEEYEAVGATFQARGSRLDDFLCCLKAVWADEVVEYNGDFYRVPPSRIEPKPLQHPHPPLLLGGTAERALVRAGRLADGWVSGSQAELSSIHRSIDVIAAAAQQAGRDPGTMRFVCRGAVKVRQDERGQLTGSLEDIGADIEQLGRSGITELFIDLNFDPLIGSPDADPGVSLDHAHRPLKPSRRKPADPGRLPMPDDRLVPEPTVLMLFGATGDLAHRLVLPALFRLAQAGLLPEDWRIVGNGRGDVSHEDFQERVRQSLEEFGPKPSEGPWEEFRSRLRFAGGGFEASDPGSLLDVLEEAERDLGGSPQRVHYFAVPPAAFGPLTEAIGEHGLAERSRVVYEKPFGTSKASFEQLDKCAHAVFKEDQIYRIDHFLGKEATQSIHVVRFGNGLFAGAWDHKHIDSVQIDVPETLDVGMRANFYESTGAILDMLVTHLFQLAGEVAMEVPGSLDAEHIAEAREEVIGSFRPLRRDEVVVGQYEGYRDIDGVPAGSRTETFVAARLWVDNDRWQGVPFLMRTGKCMAESHQRVSIRFKGRPRNFPGLIAGPTHSASSCPGTGRSSCRWSPRNPGQPGSWPRARPSCPWAPLSTPRRCPPTPGSSTTCSSATARCSPARTVCAMCGKLPGICWRTSPNLSSTPVVRGPRASGRLGW